MTNGTPILSAEQIAGFHTDGYVILRGFLGADQLGALHDVVAHDAALRQRTYFVGDGTGDATQLALWNEPGNDAFGLLARNERLVGAASQLLDDEVYFYHAKLNSKTPGGGGTWVWHQDYGYWYQNGYLYPDLLTAAVPLTPLTAESGCLELLRGSPRAGRLEHVRVGGQTGADPDRVATLEQHHERVSFLAEPGDVMLFHCNMLHTSSPNRSADRRDLLLIAYNARHNVGGVEHHHPTYTPLDVVADSELAASLGRYDGEERAFALARSDRAAETFEEHSAAVR